MRIVISAKCKTPDGEVDPRFGRAPWFLVHDSERGSWEAISNESAQDSSHGAGVRAAETVAKAGAEAVITGQVGPMAFSVLQAAGIRVYRGDARTTAGAAEAFAEGRLLQIHESSG